MSWLNSKLSDKLKKRFWYENNLTGEMPPRSMLTGESTNTDKPKTPIELLQAEILILKFRLSLYERATGYSTRRAVEDKLNLHPELPLAEIERRIKYYEGI